MHFPQFMVRPLLLTGTAGVMLVWIAAMSAASMIEASSLPSSASNVARSNQQQASAALPEDAPSSPPANTITERWKARCDDCAVIESIRHIAPTGMLPATYEISVRLRDGSVRVNRDPSPGNWRIGERIIYIEGANPPRS